MNDSKNLILAVVLSALVLLGWSLGREQLFPDRQPAEHQGRERQAAAAARSRRRSPARRRAEGAAEPRRRCSARPRASGSRRRRSQGSINLKGAQIDDLSLVRQRETIAKNSPPVRLLSPLGAPGAYFASFGWTGAGRRRRPTLDTRLDRRQRRC